MDAVLTLLIKALEATEGVLYVGWRESLAWPEGVKDTLLKLGLLKGVTAAKQLECMGCENNCFMDIESNVINGIKRSFIVCDVPEKQAQMGRILITDEQLQRWRFSVDRLVKVVHRCLEFNTDVETINNGAEYRLGWLNGAKGRRKVSIHAKPLNMLVGSESVPLSDLIYIEAGVLQVDRFRLNDMLNAKPKTEKPYQPNQDKRALGKSRTQERYAAWQSAYLSLQKDHPTKSKTWISEKIAKMDIAEGRDATTIVKHMVP